MNVEHKTTSRLLGNFSVKFRIGALVALGIATLAIFAATNYTADLQLRSALEAEKVFGRLEKLASQIDHNVLTIRRLEEDFVIKQRHALRGPRGRSYEGGQRGILLINPC